MKSSIETKLPLLQLVVKQQIKTLHSGDDRSIQQGNIDREGTSSIVDEMLEANKNATLYSIADKAAKNNVTSSAADDIEASNCTGILKKIPPAVSNIKANSQFAITIDGVPPSQVDNIKQIIYDLHHKKPEGSTEPETPDDTPKPSFLDEFYDVESMFDWLHEQDSQITESGGIKRSQLIELTQNDDWEDSHYDFFGTLNRIFNMLDENSDSTLTADEIKALIGEELGESFEDYKAKVDAYANELQSYYESLDDQGKLEFAIARTEEYLKAAGLEEQKEALDRFTKMPDLHGNQIAVGQIGADDLNPDFKQGDSYTKGGYLPKYKTENYNGQNIRTIFYDNDTDTFDAGITMDIRMLRGNCYMVVETLVHELTHATAYLYSSFVEYNGSYYWQPTQELLDRLYAKGGLSTSEYSYYSENLSSLISAGPYTDDAMKLRYIASCMWGEYYAYTQSADYNDSIAGDEFEVITPITENLGMPNSFREDGPDEKNAIIEHIEKLYPGEAVPDWKWWSYA